MTNNTETREYVGDVGVDSGQVMITDPCYIESQWKGNEFGDDKPGEYSYAGACTATLSDKGHGQLNYELGHSGAGVASRTAWGDGSYPVYAYRNSEGQIARLEILFDDFYNEEDEEA